MKGQDILFSKKSDCWETPQDLFDALDMKYNFQCDVAACGTNAKCPKFFGPGSIVSEDGLAVHWTPYRCWMNPPYSAVAEWVKKAAEEARKGATVVALLPARTGTRWFHDYIYKNRNVSYEFLRGRLKFSGATNSAPFDSMIAVFS